MNKRFLLRFSMHSQRQNMENVELKEIISLPNIILCLI